MSKKSKRAKIKDFCIRVLICFVVFVILSRVVVILKFWQNNPNQERLGVYKDELKNFNKDTKFCLDFNVNGNYILVAQDNENNITILDYSETRKEADVVARQTFSSPMTCVVGFDQTILCDLESNLIYILNEDGTFSRSTYMPVEDMSMLSLSSNYNFIMKYPSIYETFYFYDDFYLYKTRPNFEQYIRDYNMGLLKESDKIDVTNPQYLIFRQGISNGNYTDYTNVPYNDASLIEYIAEYYGKNIKKAKYSDTKIYKRFDVGFVSAKEMSKIIDKLRKKHDTVTVYDYIKFIKDKDYLDKSEKFTE